MFCRTFKTLVDKEKNGVFSQPDVSGLCDGGAIEAQNFNFAQKLN
jgi:hypothetical protein